MVGESMPERLWLGASLPSHQTNSHRTLVRTLNTRGKALRWIEIVIRKEEVACLQSSDEFVRRAGDRSPATGIDGVLVPVLEDAMGVREQVLDRHQSLHCQIIGITGISTLQCKT